MTKNNERLLVIVPDVTCGSLALVCWASCTGSQPFVLMRTVTCSELLARHTSLLHVHARGHGMPV
jgi:hypothetical protein